jgi:hypothetical protein
MLLWKRERANSTSVIVAHACARYTWNLVASVYELMRLRLTDELNQSNTEKSLLNLPITIWGKCIMNFNLDVYCNFLI